MNKLKRYTNFNRLKSAIVLNTTKANDVAISNVEFQDLLDTFKKHIVSNYSKEKLKPKYAAKNSKWFAFHL